MTLNQSPILEPLGDCCGPTPCLSHYLPPAKRPYPATPEDTAHRSLDAALLLTAPAAPLSDHLVFDAEHLRDVPGVAWVAGWSE